MYSKSNGNSEGHVYSCIESNNFVLPGGYPNYPFLTVYMSILITINHY